MILNLMRNYVLLFFQYFIGFGSALFAIVYILDGKVSYVLIFGTTLLFSISQTYKTIKSRKAGF